MKKHLGLIIQSIVAETRYPRQIAVPLDFFCELFGDMDKGCEDIYCHDCMLGYKDNQYYTSQIIKTWKQL